MLVLQSSSSAIGGYSMSYQKAGSDVDHELDVVACKIVRG